MNDGKNLVQRFILFRIEEQKKEQHHQIVDWERCSV